ncbi:NnrU family protein [Marinomonas sp. IMCC 4694]|uniref:NnrU family protein n=1 Tax=Marinomonas sp. IMCC 4694 TaxID=2605432 RepID=UPI0011E7D2F8|nr:NnrU family protein [Marinomonas sp. IMCC 4694]TYL47407.1 NnrU family protein [Marinomonas sp. IMCC 4694]
MLVLVIGLVIFFGVHSIGMFAPKWRERAMAREGSLRWKLRFGMITLIATGFIIMGYMQMRVEPVWLWFPPLWTRHASALMMLVALFFVGSAFIPNSTMKNKMGYPLWIAVKIWALAHLLSNGTLADVMVFGGFLVWAIVGFAVYRRRDRKAGVVYKTSDKSSLRPNIVSLVFAMVSWIMIAFHLHLALIGVAPFV